MNRQTTQKMDLIMDSVKQLDMDNHRSFKAVLKVKDRILSYDCDVSSIDFSYDVELSILAFIDQQWFDVYYRAYNLDNEFTYEHAVNRLLISLMQGGIREQCKEIEMKEFINLN